MNVHRGHLRKLSTQRHRDQMHRQGRGLLILLTERFSRLLSLPSRCTREQQATAWVPPSLRCQPAQPACSGCIAAIVWCPLCTLTGTERQRVNEKEKRIQLWSGKNDKIQQWQGETGRESTKIESGDSTKGVAGFTLLKRHRFGLSSGTMHRRVKTYNYITMKRYRYAYSRYLLVVLLQSYFCVFSLPASDVFCHLTELSCTLNHAAHWRNHRLQVCPSGSRFMWFLLNNVRADDTCRISKLICCFRSSFTHMFSCLQADSWRM